MVFKKEEAIVVGLAIFIFLAFIFFVKPSFIGDVILEPSSYVYDNSLINLSNNEIKLIPTITTNTASTTKQTSLQVTAAVYEGNDKLDKVNSLEHGDINVVANNNLTITLSGNFIDNDVISVYVKHNKQTDIKLCDSSEGCSRTYATANYNGNPSWINFTVSNSNSKNNFNLITVSENAKIDYVYATHFETTTNTTTTVTYPASASIETQDIQPSNISRFDYVNYTHTLNNQTINYFYSTDSGSTWIAITAKNISSVNITKIKIKAALSSDSHSTPVINSLTLIYTEVIQEIQNNSSNQTQPQDNSTQPGNQTNTTQPQDNSTLPGNQTNSTEQQNNSAGTPPGGGSESSGGRSSKGSISSSSEGNNAPSSSVPRQLEIKQALPVKEEQKEIKLFEEPENPKNLKKDTNDFVSGNVVYDLGSKKLIGLYTFIGILTFSYLIYHFKVKKAYSKTKKFKK
ncbi:hypothetical protein HYX16_03330 [Candidatus Woesearchaeota archaeon]|nr:hypothetical protein [Candidatus Woesearchaeota archaeon]